MNTRTARNSRPNISAKLPQYAPDKKLAFVESVCEELIKDRFGPWYVFESSMTANSGSVSPAVAGAVLDPAQRSGVPLSEFLGRAVSDDILFGVRSVPTSPFMTHLHEIASPKTPVTIVPGTASSNAALDGRRGSPATRHSSAGIRQVLPLLLGRIVSATIHPRGSPAPHHRISTGPSRPFKTEILGRNLSGVMQKARFAYSAPWDARPPRGQYMFLQFRRSVLFIANNRRLNRSSVGATYVHNQRPPLRGSESCCRNRSYKDAAPTEPTTVEK